MVRFGIIGTNNITDCFMEAAKQIAEFRLVAVYSRSEETGRKFSEKYGVDLVYTSLEELAASREIDAVYIASPNSFHCSQTIDMLNGGKHVLCEKPIASDSAELERMLKTAQENQVLLLEAMRPAFDPGLSKIQELLPRLGTVRRVLFQYCQYSSRYDQFKAGNVLNAFNPALSNAAVMDIGVYCIYPMVRLFGMPHSILADSLFLKNNMEGMGTILAHYPDMQAVLQYSKITNAYLPSEIQGEEGSMIITQITDIRRIELHGRNGKNEIFQIDKAENTMYYEIKEFIRLIEEEQWRTDGLEYQIHMEMEMRVMDQVRKCAGIVFESR